MHTRTEITPASQNQLPSLWRHTKLVSGVGIFVFVITQLVFGISIQNPWQRLHLYGRASSANFSWQQRFGRNVFRAAGEIGDGLKDLLGGRLPEVRLENCSLVPANLSKLLQYCVV